MMKKISFTQEWARGLSRKREAMDFPRKCLFEITTRCNLTCRHCYVVADPQKKELSTAQVCALFDQLVEAGCFHVTLTGGEPLAREDIFFLLEYARRRGLFTHLFTNATLITPQAADMLKSLQLISLEISLHSLKREHFDDVTRVAGSFDRVLEALRLLSGMKGKIVLKINITKANFAELDDLKRYVEEWGVLPVWATLLLPRAVGCADNLKLRLSPPEVLEAEDRVYGFSSENAMQLQGDDHLEQNLEKKCDDSSSQQSLFRCGAGKVGLAITAYGEVKPCMPFPPTGYYAQDHGLKDIWQELKKHVAGFQPSKDFQCPTCAVRKHCVSCPAKARLECGDMNLCPEYYRQLAQLRALKNDPQETI